MLIFDLNDEKLLLALDQLLLSLPFINHFMEALNLLLRLPLNIFLDSHQTIKIGLVSLRCHHRSVVFVVSHRTQSVRSLIHAVVSPAGVF